MRIAFFGSSLVSAYWNGAATYYRGLLRALAARGHRITFYEPDAWDRQRHRDLADPPWARVVVWRADPEALEPCLEEARRADLVVKASGVGVLDDLLERRVLELRRPGNRVVFWDVDAPATLERLARDPVDPFRPLVPSYDLVFTYGGGPPVVAGYEALGARRCVPIYNALDPDTHHPVAPEARLACDLALLANRLPDREARVRAFFLEPAARLPGRRFLLGGAGWGDLPLPANVRWLGHVPTADHNALNASALAVLNVNRESMVRFGFSPPTRVFEAAGAGACLLCDAWVGLERFLEPGAEVLVVRDGEEVAAALAALAPARARAMGAAARRRVLAEHTYARRALEVEAALGAAPERRAATGAAEAP
jgi:spore maturation protein CgeB